MKSGSIIIVIVRRTFFLGGFDIIESQCSDIFETFKRILGSISSIIFVSHIFSKEYGRSRKSEVAAESATQQRGSAGMQRKNCGDNPIFLPKNGTFTWPQP